MLLPTSPIPKALKALFPAVRGYNGPLQTTDYKLGFATPFEPGKPAPALALAEWTPCWRLKEGETYPPQPTPEQLATALTPSPVEQARDAAKAAFASLPAGKQALWEPVRAAVDAALVAGNGAGAVAIIKTVPEIYDGMEADRQAFLALFAVPASA